jgi:hypothetical protein
MMICCWSKRVKIMNRVFSNIHLGAILQGASLQNVTVNININK